ncbi:patatin-like phospholipase family protein [Frankia sp. CiP3]|uniref:patatin-like phospholipase family protein n=1 Tax=Frankia sp. CiP3 TaxID=2880971 RepID=UPI001EF4A6F6|nr:patatin-like phospholipase family protein [Frankia sp. CiP3]
MSGQAPERNVGLALSGGGSRAMAFHLGCLRELRRRDLLRRVKVVSGISGGAVLAAMWAYGPAGFEEFDDNAVRVLRDGLQRRLVRGVMRPSALVRSAMSTAAVLVDRRDAVPDSRLRHANRTEVFVDVLRDRLALHGRTLAEPTDPGLSVVLTATDLRSGGAFRFGNRGISSSRLGDVIGAVDVATAAAASAAFPLLLPALERTFEFDQDGRRRRDVVLLTDGGVYDNLGLSVLEPGRSPEFTSHVYPVDYIISCDAGRHSSTKSPRFWPARTARAFEIEHRRGQDHGRARLHEWRRSGAIEGFALPYLSTYDDRLPPAVTDLVPRERVVNCPTNFRAMPQADLEALTKRGERLTRILLDQFCPGLV